MNHRSGALAILFFSLAACGSEPAAGGDAEAGPQPDEQAAPAPETWLAELSTAPPRPLMPAPASAPEGAAPTEIDMATVLRAIPWEEVLRRSDPGGMTLQLAVQALSVLSGDPAGATALSFVAPTRTAAGRPPLRRAAALLTAGSPAVSPRQDDGSWIETAFDAGGASGVSRGRAAESYDADRGQRTRRMEIEVAAETESGETVRLAMDIQSRWDECWNGQGHRDQELVVELRGSAADDQYGGSFRMTQTLRPDGAYRHEVAGTADGHTVTERFDWRDLDDGVAEPPDAGDYQDSLERVDDGWRLTRRFADGASKIWEVPTWPDLNAVKKAESLLANAELREGARGMWGGMQPASDHHCLRLVIEPASASLSPDGDRLPLRVRLSDWRDRPVAAGVVDVSAPRLGTLSSHTGPTGPAGTWSTAYTSGEAGTERLDFSAAYSFTRVARGAILHIGDGWIAEGQWQDPEGPPIRFRLSTCDGREWTGEAVQSGVDAYGDLNEHEMSFRISMADGASEGAGPMEWRGTMTSSTGTGTVRADGTAQLSVDPESSSAVLKFVDITGTVSFRGMSGPIRRSGLGPFNEQLTPNPDCGR